VERENGSENWRDPELSQEILTEITTEIMATTLRLIIDKDKTLQHVV